MRHFALFLITALILSSAQVSHAQDGSLNMSALPANAMDDNAPITMSPDGPAMIRLNEDAASVIIANPSQATAVLENPRLIVLMPQQPGATRIMALDRNGKSLLDKRVLVGGGSSNFIRINRACKTGDCRPVSMYYCPDRCYETNVPQPGSEAQAASGDAAVPVENTPVAVSPPEAPQTYETIDENPVSIDSTAE